MRKMSRIDWLGAPNPRGEWTIYCLDDDEPHVLMKEDESISQMMEIGYVQVEVVF